MMIKTCYGQGENICKPQDQYLKYVKILKIQQFLEKSPITKWVEDMNRHFTEENMQMENQPMKRYSPSLASRKIQGKIKMQYHYTPIGRAKIKKLIIAITLNADEDGEKLDHSYLSRIQSLWKIILQFLNCKHAATVLNM